MKDVVLAVMTALKADSAITAKVPAVRIYRKTFPVNATFPLLVVDYINVNRDDDSSTGRYGHFTVRVSSFSSVAGLEEEIADLVADNMHRKVNARLTYGTAGKGVYVISVKDAGGIPDVDNDIPLYIQHRDFRVHYSY